MTIFNYPHEQVNACERINHGNVQFNTYLRNQAKRTWHDLMETTMILETLAITGVVAAFATKYLMDDEKRSDCFSTYVHARRPNIRN